MRTSILTLIGLCIAIFCSPPAFSGTGYGHQCVPQQNAIEAISNVPKCPSSKSGISGIDNTYPTGAVFVTLRPGDPGTYDFITEIHQFIREQKNSMPIKLNLVIDDRSVQNIKGYLFSYPRMQEVLNDTDHVNIIPIKYDSSGITWPQDWLQFVYSSGKPAFFRITYQGDNYKATPETIVNRDLNPGIQVARACNIPAINHKIFGQPNDTGWDATMGGNFEPLTSGIWATGTNSKISRILNDKTGYARNLVETFYSQIETLEDGGQTVIKLDAESTPVNHVDELINVVKVEDTECGFAILSASPKVAYEILKKNSTSTLSAEDESVCSQLNDGNSWPESDSRLQEDKKKIAKHGCLGFSKKTAALFLRNEKLVKLNETFQNRMTENERIIVRTLQNKKVCASPTVIRLPVLVQAGEQWSGDANPVANVVNGLVLTPVIGSSTYLYPKSNYPPFDDYVIKLMSEKAPGVKVKPTWSESYLSVKGGFHCATSTVQVCR